MCSGKVPQGRPGLIKVLPCFNEARAVCSGKVCVGQVRSGDRSCFNEARAVCSGKVSAPVPRPSVPTGFNEARAVCSGKAHEVILSLDASGVLQ